MTGPARGPYDARVYAAGGLVSGQQPPAFQRGLPNRQTRNLRPHPAREPVTYLTIAEVAAELRVSKMTVYRLVHAGEIAATRIGRSFRVPAGALDEHIAAQSTATSSKEP